MHFTEFQVTNFRGIKDITIDLCSPPNGSVCVLVGLNESGKTTVLEAINFLSHKSETLDSLDLFGFKITDLHTLIPIGQRSNFNGDIEVSATLAYEPEDVAAIKRELRKKIGFNMVDGLKRLRIKRRLHFADSKYIQEKSNNTWTLDIRGKKTGERKSRHLAGTDWSSAVEIIRPFLPSILYFPNFLFEFPSKIYLEDTGTDDDRHRFYRLVLQDILDALNNGTNLSTHVLARAKSQDPNDKKSLDGLLLEMGRNVTQTVFRAWHAIFHQDLGQKRVVFDIKVDENNFVFAQVRLEDSDGFYSIGERSLGFRWFFVFLLLTQYRGFRKGSTSRAFFLLDEPASNLHPSAQTKLLASFESLASKCKILYTTHSHHLVNPNWLEQTFVVKNEGLDYNTDVEIFNSRKTDITVTRYREFVTKHPDQTSYYKPILDVLDYRPSHLENLEDVIMVEGKNDFYTVKYMAKLLGVDHDNCLLPGTGSGTLDVPIRLYIAWGREFLVLLDSDSEGNRQRKRYCELFGRIVEDRIFTLGDIDPSWVGHDMENLFSDLEKLGIQRAIYPSDDKCDKKHFNRALQELLVTNQAVDSKIETKANFRKVFDFLGGQLRRLRSVDH